MNKIIIFDLYDTILKDIFFDFNKGLDYLYTLGFNKRCTREDFWAYSKQFIPLYDERATTFKEICFIQDEYPLFEKKFNINLDLHKENLDYCIMMNMQKVALLDEVKKCIEYFFHNNIKMYILSNSIFLASSHKKLLADFNVLKYFEDVYCSADYGIRKPSKLFFDYATEKVLNENPSNKKDDIVYIGNDYTTDIRGGVGAGVKTIWYNINQIDNEDNLDIEIVTCFSEITDLV